MPSATSEPTQIATDPTATNAPVSEGVDDARLLETLPTLDDLPSGWAVYVEDDSSDGDNTFCNADSIENVYADKPNASVSYSGGDFGPFLTVNIFYLGESAADDFMDSLDETMGCERWTDVDDDGTETVWTLTDMSFADVGDDVFARKLATETAVFPVGGDMVIVRESGFIILAANISIGGAVDSSLTEEVVTFTVDRAARIGGFD